MLAAAALGALVGVVATLGVVVLSDDRPDDTELACAALDGADADSDELFDGEDGAAVASRIAGAAQLFLAAADGDFDSELGELSNQLSRGVSLFDEETLRQGLDDAQDYCDDR